MKILAASAAMILMMLVSVLLLTNPSFLATSPTTPRVIVSIGTGAVVSLWAAATIALVASGYFFLKILNSPQHGKSILNARAFKRSSLFSDAYLNDEGKAARLKLLMSLAWFFGCWLGGVAVGLLMQFAFNGFR
ncbi:hypothetical protein ACW9YQ_16205 (plasmid) [Paraburkholderia strydomiana]